MKKIFSCGALHHGGVFPAVVLGLCAGSAVLVTAKGAVAAGIMAAVSVILAGLLGGLLKKLIPEGAEISFRAVLAAFFAIAMTMLTHAFMIESYFTVGAFIPAIMAVAAVLGLWGRPEGEPALMGSVKAGIFIAVASAVVGALCELLSAGAVFGIGVLPESVPLPAIFSNWAGVMIIIALGAAIFYKASVPEDGGILFLLAFCFAVMGTAAVGGDLVAGAVKTVIGIVLAFVLYALVTPLKVKFTATEVPKAFQGAPVAALGAAFAAVAMEGFSCLF